MESLTLRFSYQPGEYVRALRRVQISKLRALRDAVIAASVVGLAAFLWISEGYSWVVGMMLVSILFFGLLLGFGVFVLPALVSRSQPKLREPYILRFSDEGVHFRTTGIDSNLSWSLYSSWREDSDFVYLFYGPRHVTILPRRAFSNTDDEALFLRLINRHFDSRGSRLTRA
jgi:YcxB-like protein